MIERLTKCQACSGRGYHNCACWPGDCICGYGDETCEECGGDGFIDTADEQGGYWPEEDQHIPSPQTNRHLSVMEANDLGIEWTPPAPAQHVLPSADEIDALIERLLDAQQDINLSANETMSQPLCDASALIDEVEKMLRRVRVLATTEGSDNG